MCLKSSEAHLVSFSWLRKKTWDVNPIPLQEKVKPFQHMFLMIYIAFDSGKVNSLAGFMA